jgi:hypothetical protein
VSEDKVQRVNITTKTNAEWRRDLAESFQEGAQLARNQEISEWYERQVS